MSFAVKKEKIANAFGSACNSYDTSARLQQQCGEILLSYVDKYCCAVDLSCNQSNSEESSNSILLDLGSGTGYFTDKLVAQGHNVIGMDIAKGMLNYAQQKRHHTISWLQADGYKIPLADASVDRIFSNLMIQWCQPLLPVLTEIKRVLKPGGVFIFSTLLDGTLFELKTSWQCVDSDQHVIDFLTEQALLKSLSDSSLTLASYQNHEIILPYESVLHLARELKNLGANHVPKKQAKGLSGKKQWQEMMQHYQQYQLDYDEGSCYPATYKAFTGILIK